MTCPSNFLWRISQYRMKKLASSTADSNSCVGSSAWPNGVPTQAWASRLAKVTPQKWLVGLPQQQPAAKQPRRPMECPRASPGAKLSHVARGGMRFLRTYQAAASNAARKPPEKTPPACKVARLKISLGCEV